MARFYISATVAMLVLTSTQVQSAPIEWSLASGGNGHFYEFITQNDGLSSYDAIVAAAGNSSYNGLPGYLVTSTSAAEQDFLNAFFSQLGEYYIGASDAAVEGTWRWISGPEAGKLIGIGSGDSFVSSSYSNWSAFEPNDFQDNGGEDYGTSNFENATGGNWNDVPSFSNNYVVEYSSIAAVPVPASLPLLAGAIGWLYLRSRQRRVL